MKKRVIVIAAHLNIGRTRVYDLDVLQPMAGVQIASLIDHEKYDVELFHEISQGPFPALKRLEQGNVKYDVAVFSGLQKDFDRMRQLSYFFRRHGAITIAGGGLCTIYPEFSKEFFDVVCVGSVDSIPGVFEDYENGSLSEIYYANSTRNVKNYVYHEIMNHNKIGSNVHMIEASRGCNYRCGFCTLPAENSRYIPYELDTVLANIENSIKHAPFFSIRRWYPLIWFIDNHFSTDQDHLMALCEYLKSHKKIKGWGALVSQNVITDYDLIEKMGDSGCKVLFIGLESLDPEFLRKNNKKQNLNKNQQILTDIEFAQKHGIMIIYGWLFDPRISTVEQMHAQIDNLIKCDSILFPSFFSMVSPLMGTKVFFESIKNNELRPGLLVRDLDGMSIAYNNCLDPDDVLSEFSKIIFETPKKLIGFFKMVRKTWKFITIHKITSPLSWIVIFTNNFRMFRQARLTSASVRKVRNFIGGRDVLDPTYFEYPEDISEEDLQKYFSPVTIVNDSGEPLPWLKNEMLSVQSAANKAEFV